MTDAIVAEGLVKTFKGEVRALDGVDLTVPEGAVVGLLGPNGAGKTTTVRVLTTLLAPDSGRAFVGGIDVLKRPGDVRRLIGLTGQTAAVDEYLTGRENLNMVGRLYHLDPGYVRRRGQDLLERFDLVEAADRPSKTYSGGMRRRLDLAASLVASPPILFLDEPTTGLDPRSRLQMWDVISDLVSDGTTVLLTTQYLEEADRLADDIVVVDHGKVIAHGTASALKDSVGGDRVEIVVRTPDQIGQAELALRPLASGEAATDTDARSVTIPVAGGTGTLLSAIRALDAAGVELDDVALRRPTLDDVFMSLTGHAAEEDADPRTEDTIDPANARSSS